MKQLAQSALTLVSIIAIAACGGDDAASDGGGNGGGNVGFGGAQDIGQFRGILEDGGIPGANTLDANGFFAEHFTEVLPSDCGQVLCPNGMLAVGREWTTGAKQTVLQLNMTTPIDPSTLERKPMNMVVVVDVSGSMSMDNRLGYVKQGLDLMIDELDDADRLAIITYSSNARTLVPLQLELDRAELKAAVAGMVPSGSTNIYDGLERGMQMIADNFDADHQNRVILLSDGLPTAGIQNTNSIISMAEGYIGDGIGLTTIGVGRDFNVNLMRGLSERGAGNFYYVEDAAAVEEVFTDELDYFMTPIALDVELSVTTSGGYTIRDVTGTKLWQASNMGGTVHIPAAFVASRTSSEPGNGRRGGGSSIFVRLDPLSSAEAGLVARVDLRYRLPGSDEVIEQTINVENPNAPGAEVEETWVSHQAMVKNHAVFNLFLGLRDAAVQAEWNYNCAYDVLQTVRQAAYAWNVTRNDADITADIALIDSFAANLQRLGVDTERAGQRCDEGGGPVDDWEDPYYPNDDVHYQHCNMGGNGAPGVGFLLVFGALAMATRRRRRR